MMRIRSAANRFMLVATVALAAGSAAAQTCDSLLGGVNCAGKSPGGQQVSRTPASARGNNDWRLGGGSGFDGLGGSLATSDDQPATFGAITFGGGGTTCSGLFRSRNC